MHISKFDFDRFHQAKLVSNALNTLRDFFEPSVKALRGHGTTQNEATLQSNEKIGIYGGNAMIFSFTFFYLLGVMIYFCHIAITIINSTNIISSQINFTEEELKHLFVNYFGKILFQTVMMTVFPISFTLYIQISTCFQIKLFITSGLFTVIWLMITGILIKLVYYFATHNTITLYFLQYFRLF